MANLVELQKYKNSLALLLMENVKVMSLLEAPPGNVIYDRIFPFEYVPDKTDTDKSIIAMECVVPDVSNDVIKTVDIYVYIIVHKGRMKVESGVRTDALAAAIDRVLNGSRDFGFGRLQLESVDTFKPNEEFYGRVLVYTTKEVNRNV